MRRQSAIKLLVGLCWAAVIGAHGSPANSADIRLRPDLAATLDQLKPIYPFDSFNIDEQGTLPPLLSAELEGEGYDPFSAENDPTVIEISGEIAPGDSEKLFELMAERYSPTRIVLSSPGGDFAEAMSIGLALRESMSGMGSDNIEVHVLDKQRCMSACAVIFALVHYDAWSPRYIEKGGEVGFHMPFVMMGDTSKLRVKVEDAMALAIDLVAQFNELVVGGANSPAFLKQILEYRSPDEFFTITGDQEAWAWGFMATARDEFAEPADGAHITAQVLRKLCSEFAMTRRWFMQDVGGYRFINNHEPERDEAADAPLDDFLSNHPEVDVALVPYIGTSTCLIRRSADGTIGIAMPRAPTPCASEAPAAGNWCVTDPRRLETVTKGFLANAYGCYAGLETKMFGVGEEATVKIATTLRSAPAQEGLPVVDLGVGESVRISGCETDHTAEVWYFVEAGGKSGWLPAIDVKAFFFPT